jgi:hypothetical protein
MARTEIRGEQIKDNSVTGDDVDESTLIIQSIKDTDNDTKIQCEESADEDKIRFDTAGVERLVINSDGGIAFGNASASGAPASWNFFNFKGGGVRVAANNFYCDNDKGIVWGDSSVLIKGNASASAESLTIKANYNAYIHVDGVNDAVGINTVTPGSGFHVASSVSFPTGVLRTSAYTITADDFCIVADCNSSAFTLTLPSATDAMAGRIYTIKRMDSGDSGGSNQLTVSRNGKNIDNVAGDLVLGNLDAVVLQCIGASGGWIRIGSFMAPL